MTWTKCNYVCVNHVYISYLSDCHNDDEHYWTKDRYGVVDE